MPMQRYGCSGSLAKRHKQDEGIDGQAKQCRRRPRKRSRANREPSVGKAVTNNVLLGNNDRTTHSRDLLGVVCTLLLNTYYPSHRA